jgi:hypothetical protein
VFSYGENEWQELLVDGDDEPTYQAGGYAFHPSRTPNELALKWRQLKAVMRKDIMRVRAETKGERIITKHEWMMGVLDKLEKHDKTASLAKNASSASSVENAYMLDEETTQMLYEALFIDPSKLTPYQHAQLEYQRQVQQKEMQANANNAAKRTLQNLASASASRLTKQHSVSPVIGVQPSSILVETI